MHADKGGGWKKFNLFKKTKDPHPHPSSPAANPSPRAPDNVVPAALAAVRRVSNESSASAASAASAGFGLAGGGGAAAAAGRRASGEAQAGGGGGGGGGGRAKGQGRVLGAASVDMTQPMGCGSFKNAYIGTFGEEKIVVLRHRDGGPGGNSELQKEIAMLRKLPQHINIVRYIGNFVQADLSVCIAVEFCPHGVLDHWLSLNKTRITSAQRAIIVRQIAAGMRAVASATIIHRDLAAHNIIVGSHDPLTVKVMDFGRATLASAPPSVIADPSTLLQPEVFAVRWAAPEILAAPQSRLAPWSEKSDVWAYAVTVWQVYTDGEVPYTLSMADEAVRKRVLNGGCPPTPKTLDDKVIKSVVEKCHRKDPESRLSFAAVCSELNVAW